MENQYFRKALSSFIYDFASGDSIRRYAKQGMSVNQIKEALSFPTPIDKIRETIWNYYLSTNRILLEKPGKENLKQYKYVKELSSYGKISYRKIEIKEISEDVQSIYVEIPFGLIRYKNPEQYQEILNALSPDQRDFIDGLFQKRCLVYYRLDEQMERILQRLSEKHLYEHN